MKENEVYEYASVYLLDNPYCIDCTYDYFIPFEMRGLIARGTFVTVPFGRGNRKQLALVSELCRFPSVKDTKPIVSVSTKKIALSEEIMGLCRYLKEQVLCTVGDAVRCAVPSSVLGKMSEYYYPAPKALPNSSADLSLADLFVYNYICERSCVRMDSLQSKFGTADANEAVKSLIKKGFICRELRAAGVGSGVYNSTYKLKQSRDECIKILNGESSIKLSSKKQKELLNFLCGSENEITAEQISEACSASTAQIKALLEKGIIEEIKTRAYRQGFSYEQQDRPEIVLNDEQNAAFCEIKKGLDSHSACAYLLHGVTGSGKTNVMIKAIEETLKLKKGVILLLPEISLTPQTVGRFYSYFGDRIALVHSGLSAGERYDAYEKICNGDADIVIGTRSAVFSPLKNIGLIIMDEEHEASYKSETSPKYHARDVARYRCAYNNAVMLLASATPSVESYTKVRNGKYKLLTLKHRYGDAKLPEVVICDMRNEPDKGASPLGSRLISELGRVLDAGEQAILFLNRRGYNTMINCRSCGSTITCPHCSVAMNYHTKKGNFDEGFLFCHQCGYKMTLPKKCPVCSSEHLLKLGFGTQKIEQELSRLFPNKKILRMDADTTSQKQSYEQLLSSFRNHEADILLGTQMVTKGHDFPDVTLVGVLLADMSLYLDDYHANERTFSMLTQVIGRAGRSDKCGMAIIQTNNPDNDVIKLSCSQDYEKFYDNEIRLRKLLVFPPYCDIALLTVTSSDEKKTFMNSKRLREEIDVMLKGAFKDVSMIVFGPFEAPIYKLDEKYRMRMVLKCRLNRRSREMLDELLVKFGKEGSSLPTLTVDLNPSGL